MSLTTFFSLSPLNPFHYGYDTANQNAPHAYAFIQNFGVVVSYGWIWTLANQYRDDRVIVGHDAVPLTNQDLWTPHPYQACMSRVYFRGYNVSTENQYLLILELEQIQEQPYAQIFVNNDLVDTLQVTGVEQHAILLDCPGHDIIVQVWVRVASPSFTSTLAFRGVDCYLL